MPFAEFPRIVRRIKNSKIGRTRTPARSLAISLVIGYTRKGDMVKAAVGARLQDVAYRLRNLRLRRRKRSSGTQAGALWLRCACVALSGVLQSKKLRAYVALSGVLVVCLAYLWPSPCCSWFGLTCFGCVGAAFGFEWDVFNFGRAAFGFV